MKYDDFQNEDAVDLYRVEFVYGATFESELKQIYYLPNLPSKSNFKKKDLIKLNDKEYYVRDSYYSFKVVKDLFKKNQTTNLTTLIVIVHDRKPSWWE